MSQAVLDVLILNAGQNLAYPYLQVYGEGATTAGSFYYNGTSGLWTTSLDNTSGYNYQAPVVLGANGVPIDGGSGTNPAKIVTGSATLPTYTSGSGVYISQVTVTLVSNAIFNSGSTYHVLATLRINGANAQANIQVQYNSASSFTLYSVSPTLVGSTTVDFLAIGY